MKRPFVPAAWFGIVLGLVGMGQAWRVAARVWGMPALVGEGVLVLAVMVWAGLLVAYLRQALERPAEVTTEAILSGLELTGHFLDTRVFQPSGSGLPEIRARLPGLIRRYSR